MDNNRVTFETSTVKRPWKEVHAELMARVNSDAPSRPAPERGPEFGHGASRYNLPRSTTKGGRR